MDFLGSSEVVLLRYLWWFVLARVLVAMAPIFQMVFLGLLD